MHHHQSHHKHHWNNNVEDYYKGTIIDINFEEIQSNHFGGNLRKMSAFKEDKVSFIRAAYGHSCAVTK